MSKASRAQRAARQGRDERQQRTAAAGIAGRSANWQTPIRIQLPLAKSKPASRKRASDSDALTGAPRDPSALVIKVRDWDQTRQLYRGQPIPTRLHGRAIDGGDDRRDDAPGQGATRRGSYGLGAPVFSHGFLHYLAPVLPEAVRVRRARRDEWWTVASAIGPLIRRFGLNAVTASAAVERGADVVAVAREMHVTPTRVRMWQKSLRAEFARSRRRECERELSPASVA